MSVRFFIIHGWVYSLLIFVLSCTHELPPPCSSFTVTIDGVAIDADHGRKNGRIFINANGDSKFYTYSLDKQNFQASDEFVGLVGDSIYNLYVRNSWNCIFSSQLKVGLTDSCKNITLNVQTTPATLGKSDGIVQCITTGGIGFFYKLNRVDTVWQQASAFTKLPAGTYIATAYDSLGGKCSRNAIVTVGSTNPCAGVTVTVNLATTNPTLNQSNGQITATASGASSFNYSLNGGGYQSSNVFSNLPAGSYTVIAKSENACSGAAQAVLTPVNPCTAVVIGVTTSVVQPTLSQNNGAITVQATGGSGFTFSLNGGAYQASNTFYNLVSGNYSVSAMSSTGCVGVSQVNLPAVDPCAKTTVLLTTSLSNPIVGQNNGSITVSASGGSLPFTYSLNGGAFQSGNTFSNLSGGTYTVTAKNTNGCIGVTQIVLTPTNPCATYSISVTTTKTDPGANQSNGSILVSANGGTTGFTYSLNGGVYQVSSAFTGLATGNYTISAKNADGCTGTAQVALGTANPCASITVSVSGTVTNATLTQANGSIVSSATGGTGITYSKDGTNFQASGTFTGLTAGNYTITAQTSAGCLGSAQFTVGTTDPCAGVTVAVSGTATGATLGKSDGSVSVSASGGSGFSYSINNGAYQVSNTFTGLAAGVYTISAKNSNGCIGSAQITVSSIDPCAGVTVSVTGTVTNATLGNSDGTIAASATGGTGITYSLNGGTFQASGTFTGLTAGTYTVTAKTSLGCTGSNSFSVGTTNPCQGVTVVVNTVVTNATTGKSNGSVNATATGGSGFTYSLDGGAYQTSGTFTGLAATSHTITAKSSAGCTGTTSFTVLTVDPCSLITISISTATTTSLNCVTPGTGTITVTASGSSGFQYNVNGGAYQTSNLFSALAPGTYTIGVKDVNNCPATAPAVVSAVPGALFSAVKTIVQASCGNNGSRSTCHLNGQSQSGYNFDTDCNIVKHGKNIYNACVNYRSAGVTQMPVVPPQTALTSAQLTAITNWFNAGYTYEK